MQTTKAVSHNIDDLTLKAIVKWKNHPSILKIATEHENMPKFSFNFLLKEQVLKETEMLDSSKAIQESDVPVKIKETDIFAEAICKIYNESLYKK